MYESWEGNQASLLWCQYRHHPGRVRDEDEEVRKVKITKDFLKLGE